MDDATYIRNIFIHTCTCMWKIKLNAVLEILIGDIYAASRLFAKTKNINVTEKSVYYIIISSADRLQNYTFVAIDTNRKKLLI